MPLEPTVYVVDDDQAVLKSMCMLFRAGGLAVSAFDSPADFLASLQPEMTGCLVLDIRMPGMDGLELQARLLERDVQLPVIFLTGHADVPKAVRAMKQGAVDFLEKPYDDEVLLHRVQYALAKGALSAHRKHERVRLAERLEQLTPREREALNLIVAGRTNKEIARQLEISPRTVEVHRARLMRKLEADSLSELVRMVLGSA
ncbi:MAG TPA: sigma-70 family RNA polymerase sigma factor [Gammaproteobacteria bacterium]